jgi:hypothetical protein
MACFLGLLTVGVHIAGRAWDWVRDPLGWSQSRVFSGPVVLERIQALQRLETCRYRGEVVVRGRTGGLLPAWLVGDRVLFVGRGEVVAGLDLARLRPQDVRIAGSSLTLRLPESEILSSRLDNRESEVADRETGLLSQPDRTLESRVRAEAEDRIRSAAVENGVLRTAEQKGREVLSEQLHLFGFREVHFL